ncbi:MAG: hypothetical protein [Circular genetic element sp.]|nr:MAG: hypothetical protein [Circular genetic element sp.]
MNRFTKLLRNRFLSLSIYQCFSRLIFIDVTITNVTSSQLKNTSVIITSFLSFTRHVQKHIPETCARRRSLTPRRCNNAIARRYSIRLFFK